MNAADEAFRTWSDKRGVWPRLTHHEIFLAGRESVQPTSNVDEQWVLGLIGFLGDVLEKRIGESITLDLTDVVNVHSALISGLSSWRDVGRINYLDSKGADWAVRMGSVEMGRGRLREAMDRAILKCEGLL